MTPEEIKSKILELSKEYYRQVRPDARRSDYVAASGKKLGEEELCNMIEASLDMWLTAGRFNAAFEKKFAEKLGVAHALTANSGSSANLLALTALTSSKLGEKRLKKGDEVITVAAGFPTTVFPIVQNGLIPVFVDVSLDSYNIDASKIEAALSPKTKCVFLAHTLGNMFDTDKISELCEKRGLWLIEDSCDALGAKRRGAYAGTIGHIGTFSFYPAHHLTMGEGGAVVTNDTRLYRILLSLRDWGRDCWCAPGHDDTCHARFKTKRGALPAGYDHKYTYSHVGYNLKITDWQAACGLAQLDKLDGFLARRRENAAVLLDGLADLRDFLILPRHDAACEPSWFGFLISVKPDAPFTKQEIVEYLEAHGVGTRQLFAGNLLRQPVMTDNDVLLRIGGGEMKNSRDLTQSDYEALPVTEFIMNNTFWVGVAQNLTPDDVRVTVKTVHDFVRMKTG